MGCMSMSSLHVKHLSSHKFSMDPHDHTFPLLPLGQCPDLSMSLVVPQRFASCCVNQAALNYQCLAYCSVVGRAERLPLLLKGLGFCW